MGDQRPVVADAYLRRRGGIGGVGTHRVPGVGPCYYRDIVCVGDIQNIGAVGIYAVILGKRRVVWYVDGIAGLPSDE